MNELPDLLKTLHLKYVEPQLANLMEEARIHSLTYDAFLRRVLSRGAWKRANRRPIRTDEKRRVFL
jgi:hypothetical protein